MVLTQGVLRAVHRLVSRPKSKIVAPGVEYVPTWDDWLWLARACNCEAGSPTEYPLLAWAMVNRFVAFRQNRWRGAQTLASLVKGFSQPVNPHWIHGTGPAARAVGTPRMSPRKVNRRRWCSSRSWEWLSTERPDLYRMIMDFAHSHAPANPFPPGWKDADNFASGDAINARPEGYDPDGNGEGNVYLVDSPPLDGPVRIIPRGESA